MRKVHIVGIDSLMTTMYLRMGWNIVNYIDESVSLIQFTGGEDVDPSYYGETKHARTYSNPRRDAEEILVYNEWVGILPMSGICRGGQLLNVLNGGKMWQHVTNHGVSGTHPATCALTGEEVEVTSVHHQMMIPGPDAKLLLTASQAKRKEGPTFSVEGVEEDVEAILYEKTKCLCYQPHPEYVSVQHPCALNYFKYLDLIL